MKLELLKDGVPILTLDAPAIAQDEFTIIPSDMLINSTLSASSFEALYYKCLKEAKTYVEAYERAEMIHEQYFKCRRYADYNSFRNVKRKR